MKKISLIFVLCSFLFSSCLSQKEQAAYQNSISKMLTNNHFIFIAQQVNPMRGNIVNPQLLQLDGSYSVKFSPDTLKCYLPYFGVAQQAPYGSTDNSLNFTSTHFSYSKITKSNGNYLITIKPFNTQYVNQLVFEISKNGATNLSVNSNLRDPISYTGELKVQ